MTGRFRKQWILPAALGLGLGACGIPTQSPVWDTRWVLPADHVEVGVSDFLPDRVTVTPDGRNFSVSVDPFTFSETLGEICPPCVPFDGQTVPKPAFTARLLGNGTLPEDVLSADIAHLRLLVRLSNGFDFDPIRPAAGVSGRLTLEVYADSSAVVPLAEIVIDGDSEAFPAGTDLDRTVDITDATLMDGFRVELALDSPAGDSILVDTGAGIAVTVTTEEALLSSVRAGVAGRAVSIDPVELDLGDLSRDLVDRVQNGTLDLLVTNPIGAPVNLLLRVRGDFPDIEKSAVISAADSSVTRVGFTGAELQTFLGQPGVRISGEGIVPPYAAPVTVAPGDTVRIGTRLDVILKLGDSGD